MQIEVRIASEEPKNIILTKFEARKYHGDISFIWNEKYHFRQFSDPKISDLPRGGGGGHMLRARVCAAHMAGFWSQNDLNKGPCFGRFSINMGGLSRNCRKTAKNKNGSPSAKFR